MKSDMEYKSWYFGCESAERKGHYTCDDPDGSITAMVNRIMDGRCNATPSIDQQIADIIKGFPVGVTGKVYHVALPDIAGIITVGAMDMKMKDREPRMFFSMDEVEHWTIDRSNTRVVTITGMIDDDTVEMIKALVRGKGLTVDVSNDSY